jgi:hypothetical protein
MTINENEYGAPWNDQFYDVVFYFKLTLDDILFTSGNLETSFTLSGPKQYSYSELKIAAESTIYGEYDFDYDEIVIVNINQQ